MLTLLYDILIGIGGLSMLAAIVVLLVFYGILTTTLGDFVLGSNSDDLGTTSFATGLITEIAVFGMLYGLGVVLR